MEVCVLKSCGNGVIDNVEECDDGNMLPGDGCNFNCIKENCTNLN